MPESSVVSVVFFYHKMFECLKKLPWEIIQNSCWTNQCMRNTYTITKYLLENPCRDLQLFQQWTSISNTLTVKAQRLCKLITRAVEHPAFLRNSFGSISFAKVGHTSHGGDSENSPSERDFAGDENREASANSARIQKQRRCPLLAPMSLRKLRRLRRPPPPSALFSSSFSCISSYCQRASSSSSSPLGDSVHLRAVRSKLRPPTSHLAQYTSEHFAIGYYPLGTYPSVIRCISGYETLVFHARRFFFLISFGAFDTRIRAWATLWKCFGHLTNTSGPRIAGTITSLKTKYGVISSPPNQPNASNSMLWLETWKNEKHFQSWNSIKLARSAPTKASPMRNSILMSQWNLVSRSDLQVIEWPFC